MTRPFSLKSFLILGIFIALSIFLGSRLSEHPSMAGEGKLSAAASANGGKPIPSFSLPLVEGNGTLESASLTQGGPVLLNFFASWCTPCLAELPLLGKLKEKGLPSVGIAWHDKPDATRAWLSKNGSPYRLVASDEKGGTGIAFGLKGIPETYLIDAQGSVVYHHVGPVAEADIPMLLGKAGIAAK